MHLQWVAATGIGLALVGTARADLGPPPGQRYVTPIHIIETGREYPGYEFVAILGSDCGRAFRVDIRPGRPARLSDPGREYWQLGIQLFAVPKALADECRTAEDLKDLTDRGVAAGVLVEANPQSKFNARLYFRPVNDPRNDMIVRHRIVGLNPAEGQIVVETVEIDVADRWAAADERKAIARWATAGVIAIALFCGLGLWLRGRRRRA